MSNLDNLKTGLFMELTLIIWRSRYYLFNKLSVIEKSYFFFFVSLLIPLLMNIV